ncbi:MAG: 2-C-methyl-D-erythritol 2,4-cyclodiphosphate synthase [Vicinamibacterales bacterium]|nr:2-C-methyl-D-erythritol 2,4-cyclodiphosphate synthase [Vicinamibacterales bacterium]
MFVSAILAAGGRGTRLGAPTPKQLLSVGDRSILQRSFDTLDAHDNIHEIVVALPVDIAAAPPGFLVSSRKPVRIVGGGARRQDSVALAFARTAANADVVVIHDAARPFASADLFTRVILAASRGGAAIAALQAQDTVKEATTAAGIHVVAKTISRDSIYLAQTPQAFTRQVLAEAIMQGSSLGVATDEATLAERAGHPVRLVDGEASNIKITTEHDLRVSQAMARGREPGARSQESLLRIGTGYDLHRLGPGRKLIIGGVEISHELGLVGHSDADVLCHAITDAILGAAAQGDIGRHFPDTDPAWKGADSIGLLKRAVEIVRTAGFVVSNIDAVVIAERPKMAPHIDAMRRKLSDAMGIDISAVSVKGKTNEQVGALGRNEAIAVHAIAMLSPL